MSNGKMCADVLRLYPNHTSREGKLRHDSFGKRKAGQEPLSGWVFTANPEVLFFSLYTPVCTLSSNDLRIYIPMMCAALSF